MLGSNPIEGLSAKPREVDCAISFVIFHASTTAFMGKYQASPAHSNS